jgi:hypothetical protein
LKEEHELSVFESRVLRRIFRVTGEEVTGGCKKLYNEEHHNLYSSPEILLGLDGHVMYHVYRILIRKSDWNRWHGKHATRREVP